MFEPRQDAAMPKLGVARRLTALRACIALAPWIALPACGRVGFDSGTDASSADATEDPSLVAHYRFEDDPLDGVEDSSGRAHTGSCTACPTVDTGHLGSSYSFDGTSTMISVAHTADFATTTGVTAAAWISRASGTSRVSILGKLLGGSGANSWQLNEVDQDLEICSRDGTTFCKSTSGQPIASGVWQHVAYTWDMTTHRGYVNGALVSTVDNSMELDTGQILIGGDIDGVPVAEFPGKIDDVRIYSRALSSAEIAALASM